MVDGFGLFISGFGELFEFIEDLPEFFFLFGRYSFHFMEKIFHDTLGSQETDTVRFCGIGVCQFTFQDLPAVALQFLDRKSVV